jgi:hypothetical protein
LVRVTRDPVSVIEPYMGVGDAWALVAAANRAWSGDAGEWVTFDEPVELSTPGED